MCEQKDNLRKGTELIELLEKRSTQSASNALPTGFTYLVTYLPEGIDREELIGDWLKHRWSGNDFGQTMWVITIWDLATSHIQYAARALYANTATGVKRLAIHPLEQYDHLELERFMDGLATALAQVGIAEPGPHA
ncbi:MAG: hypothetical protein AAF092_13405 [Pseudomonadota bacterium]